MHALHGIKTRRHTFTLSVIVGDKFATALVDTGSTTTFMTPHFANIAGCQLTPTRKLIVSVANGEKLSTEFMCSKCVYNIQGNKFTSYFHILKLKGYDIILGAD